MKRILAERFNEHNPAECKLFVEAQSQEPQGVCSYKIILGGVDHPKAMYVSLSCSTGELLFYYYTMPLLMPMLRLQQSLQQLVPAMVLTYTWEVGILCSWEVHVVGDALYMDGA